MNLHDALKEQSRIIQDRITRIGDMENVITQLRSDLAAAKAQLAAVREIAESCPRNGAYWQQADAVVRIKRLLTPAPSPGAGEDK